MKEDFLHYVWKHQKFPLATLRTSQNESIEVIRPGFHNQHDGPDFLQAELKIGKLRWVGSVEIHLKSSDWYRHQHQLDKAYDSTVLHVVWEDDIEVCLANGTLLPTLVLSTFISPDLVAKLSHYFKQKQSFIPCEDQFSKVPQEVLNLWKERLYIDRLSEKATRIQLLLEETQNDWEAVLFVLLARNFGLNINGAAFFSVAKSIPFGVLRKLREEVKDVEALFLGQAGLISAQTASPYGAFLWERFSYIRVKHSLPTPPQVSFHFSRLRPHNFPILRWANWRSYMPLRLSFLAVFSLPKGWRQVG